MLSYRHTIISLEKRAVSQENRNNWLTTRIEQSTWCPSVNLTWMRYFFMFIYIFFLLSSMKSDNKDINWLHECINHECTQICIEGIIDSNPTLFHLVLISVSRLFRGPYFLYNYHKQKFAGLVWAMGGGGWRGRV